MANKIILGIETSCDDNGIAIICNNQILINNVVNNAKILQPYGGVVPEIVARFHCEQILNNLQNALLKTKISLNQINEIAYTAYPGLQNCLLVGKIVAKSLSAFLNIKAFAINHIYGHIFSSFIDQKLKFPFLALIASGKTTSIFLVKDTKKIVELTKTLDDAIGESIDKVGKKLGYDYPCGPLMDLDFDLKKAVYPFPKQKVTNHFSFSGIKNYAFNLITKLQKNDQNHFDKVKVASSYLKSTIDTLIAKLQYYQTKYHIDTIAIGGGVAANSYFQNQIEKLFQNHYTPKKCYATDNAAMIAYYHYCNTINN